jgi:drug/metabolite transporter (DMT)-like permease
MSGKHVTFAVIATIWGLTWIAIKTGVAALPPFLFASLRLLAAGSTLLLLARLRSRRGGRSLSIRGLYRRILVAALLVNTVTYGMVFWGMQYVPSGLSSVVNLSLIPVGLFTIGLAAGEETYSRRKVAAIVLGVIGLIVLFLPKLDFEGDGLALLGMVALVVGTLAYCWGSILSRPLLRALEPLALSGWLTLWGGAGLMVLALVFEDVRLPTLRRLAELPVLASWLFLVLGGSVIAFTLYLRLLRDWGPTRAGMYAFVSPVIAVVLGMLVLAEPFGSYELVGSTLMLSGAALALRG